MRKGKQIKDMSIYEASEFWDDHTFMEFEDIEEVKNVRFSLKKKKYIGLDMTLYKKIKSRADKLHLPEDDLINNWLLEKIK